MLQPPAQKWRLPIFQLVTHPMFDLFIIVLIILNTVVLAADHHPMDPSAEVTLEVSNCSLLFEYTIHVEYTEYACIPYCIRLSCLYFMVLYCANVYLHMDSLFLFLCRVNVFLLTIMQPFFSSGD